MKKNKITIMKKIIYSILITGLLTSCGGGDKKEKLEKLKQQSAELLAEINQLEKEIALSGNSITSNIKVKDVAVIKIAYEPFKHFIDVQGRVEGDENVTVSAKMGGVVNRILVNEGDEVREGQTLAELENTVLQQSLEEVNTALAFATDVYEKQKNLWDQKIGSEMQFLSAKNNKEGLEKKRSTLKEQLELSKIKSPINGVIDAVDIKIGQSLMPGMPAIRVVNLNTLKVKAEISETYAAKVKKGNDVVIFFPDLDKEITSKIFYTSKVINNITRTFSAEANLDEQNPDYRPNMIVVLKVVDYQKDSSIVIPINYIQQSGTSSYVYVANTQNRKKMATKREIKVGQIYNGKAEITEGLNLNDQLITVGYLDLAESMLINF
jgi:RND family efflux transporter MFP subunit